MLCLKSVRASVIVDEVTALDIFWGIKLSHVFSNIVWNAMIPVQSSGSMLHP